MTSKLSTTLHTAFPDAVDRTTKALADQGFGVLTTIDVKATLKQKLGADMEDYLILGACNPPLAHRALSTDLDAGIMMPCNIAVYEHGADTVVTAIDPMQTFAATDPALRPVAEEVRAKLVRVLERLR